MWQRDHVHIHLHIEDHLGINDVHFDGVLCKGWLRTMSRRMAKHPIDIYISVSYTHLTLPTKLEV